MGSYWLNLQAWYYGRFWGFLMSDFGKLVFPENRPNREPIATEKPFVAILLNLIALLTGLTVNEELVSNIML